MRTTVTLDPDVQGLIRRAMKERDMTFKQALNDAVRAGAAPGGGEPRAAVVPSYDMGPPLVDITKALRLAGELEDEEIIRKLARGA